LINGIHGGAISQLSQGDSKARQYARFQEMRWFTNFQLSPKDIFLLGYTLCLLVVILPEFLQILDFRLLSPRRKPKRGTFSFLDVVLVIIILDLMLSNANSLLILALGFSVIFAANYLYLYVYRRERDWDRLLNQTMGTMLVVFGTLKLLDLAKFVEIFRRYDLISMNVGSYAYAYPFIEILLGVMFWRGEQLAKVSMATVFLMVTSIASVITSLYSGQKLRCGCLGSFLRVPLSYVTLTENSVMLAMSLSHFV
jgi:hypothetical protein